MTLPQTQPAVTALAQHPKAGAMAAQTACAGPRLGLALLRRHAAAQGHRL